MEAASGLWRSEDMVQLQFHMQREAAHDTVLKLGQLGMVQFLDLNSETSAFQRDFAQEVRRCDDMERKIRYLQEEISKVNITAIAVNASEEETLNSLESKIDEKDSEVRETANRLEALVIEQNRTREHLEVLLRDHGSENEAIPTSIGGLTFLTGVIPKDKFHTFERMVYRMTRGNSFIRHENIREPFLDTVTKDEITKCVFTVYFSSRFIHDRLKRLCEANGATIYAYAESRDQLARLRDNLQQQQEALRETWAQSERRHRQVLSTVATTIDEWKKTVITEKAVYTVLNMLQFNGSTVIARGWCPCSEFENIKAALRMGEISSGAQVSTIVEEVNTRATRPTFFKTNKFTGTFQGIVDSYGIARYKEVNPGVFTIVTFPYLFGIMYGDIGHGLILTLFAAFMIFIEKNFEGKPMNEIFGMIFGGRYLLFAMGIFATYVGILYNDMFGISTEIFASGYTWPPLNEKSHGMIYPTSPNHEPNIKPENPVSFGIDSAWSETENKLEFYNSVKMKCAIVIGIVQMSAGVFLSLMNHLYFKDKLSIYYRFIPEIVFLSCTFGYMALLIIIKWLTTWGDRSLAPSLLETMTNFFLAPGDVKLPLYPGQAGVQVLLLLVAFSMVPILLAGIPYFKKKEHEEKVRARGGHLTDDEDEEDGEHFDFSEIMIHQIIHTIEYVLGCVSNTASYLRLWALSLAHAQLSDVFWNFAFMMTVGLDTGSGVFIFIGFAVWLSATLGVLLMMESLSAFLHSLRLHWVEFQSKFYAADGIAFEPFDLNAMLAP